MLRYAYGMLSVMRNFAVSRNYEKKLVAAVGFEPTPPKRLVP